MEASDLNLLQGAPSYHLQAVLKSRRLPQMLRRENVDTLPDPSSMAIVEIAEYLFDPASIRDAIRGLSDIEQLILYELVACGGRANSRDLALYLTSSSLIPPAKGKKDTRPLFPSNPDTSVHTVGQQEKVPFRGRGTAGYNPGPSALPLWAGNEDSRMLLQYPTPHPHGIFEQALRHLLLLGLVFWGKQTNLSGRDYASGMYDGVLIVPRAVIEAVKEEKHAQSHSTDSSLNSSTASDQEMLLKAPLASSLQLPPGVHALQRTLYLYWSLVAAMREGLPLVSNGLLSRAALRQVMEAYNALYPSSLARDIVPLMGISTEQVRIESDVPHLLFIRLLLMKLGLLYERRGTVYAAPADGFFALPLLERARRCYRLWLETPFWNELAYLPDVIVRPGPAPLEPAHEELMQARRRVVELVLREQYQPWREFPAFIARAKLYAPYLLFPRQYGPRAERYSMGSNPYGWDFRLRRGWLAHREGWYLVEGDFIRAVVVGPLHWLGLVELNNQEHPRAFHLAPGVSLITSDVPSDIEEAASGRLIVQPNFELVALAPVSEALLVQLDRFAERIRLEHIAQYRLTRASVIRAIQLGLHAKDILQRLEQAAGKASDIPQNVQYSLMEWERQARRIELWPGVALLEVDDSALLDALFAAEETRSMLGRRLSPVLAEVVADQLTAIQEMLWQRDYLSSIISSPTYDNLLESGRLPACEPQWRLQENGVLQPRYVVLNLYLAAELARITERDEATGWQRITPQSISNACASGLALEHIVRFLQHYCVDGIPASFLIRLKLWAGGYGDSLAIEVIRAPLLSLSPQILQDLQTDEEIGALLSAEVTSENRLVRVAPEALERVVELLRERGFEVQ